MLRKYERSRRRIGKPGVRERLALIPAFVLMVLVVEKSEKYNLRVLTGSRRHFGVR
jgi:hypothetical protein